MNLNQISIKRHTLTYMYFMKLARRIFLKQVDIFSDDHNYDIENEINDDYFCKWSVEESEERLMSSGASDKELELEGYTKCPRCGFFLTPMYDKFPYWIKFCSKCDYREEDGKNSPLSY